MSDSRSSLSDSLPAKVARELEEYAGPMVTCDWGGCNGEPIGWAICDFECPEPLHDAEPQWLSICAVCAVQAAVTGHEVITIDAAEEQRYVRD